MKIYTIGFTKKNAEEFFESIKKHHVDIFIDVRLNNISQLSGFAKGPDLKYFLKEICKCDYAHDLAFAPTKELLDGYRNKNISWMEYESEFNKILQNRKVDLIFEKKYSNYQNICRLCSECAADKCHRRLVAEYLKKYFNVEIIHI